jgi:hypothetical protein
VWPGCDRLGCAFHGPGGADAFERLLRDFHQRCEPSSRAQQAAHEDLADPAFLYQELEVLRAANERLARRLPD